MKKTYTDKQGQYLAFIYYYAKIHGCAPSEAEMQQYFRVSPTAVHQMVLRDSKELLHFGHTFESLRQPCIRWS